MIAFTLFLLILCLLASAFFSASETALFSLSQMKIRSFSQDPSPRRQLVASLVSGPRGLLATILMMNVLVNILVQNVASSLFGGFGGWELKVGVPLVLTLLVGEIIPKTLALPNNERIALAVAPAISTLHRVLGPVRRVIGQITAFVSKFMFFFLRPEKSISKEELRYALRASERSGILSPEETGLIEGVLRFQETSLKEIVRPRDELLVYDIAEPPERLRSLFTDEQCSRVPVCTGGLENILGIMEAHRLAAVDAPLSTEVIRAHLAPPLYVPESMYASTLFDKFAEMNEQLAIVVDEYGSISGIVTREDLVEVVVGEIADRRDEKSLYTRAGANVIIASGKLELDEFNSLFDTSLESESNLVTLGGWLTEQLGHLPTAGTKLLTRDFLFQVLAADPNRVRRVYIRRLSHPGGGRHA